MPLEGASVTSFAYGLGQLAFLDKETLVTPTGNGLVCYPINQVQQKHLWGGASNLGASEGPLVLGPCPKGSHMAYAKRDGPGMVTIAESASLTIVKEIEVGAELGYKQLALSSCSTRLAVVSGQPEHKLSLWDWEADIKILEHSVGEASSGSGLSFFPATPSVVVSCGRQKATVLRVDMTTSSPMIHTAEVNFSTMQEGEYVTGHSWTPERELYIGTSRGQLLLVRDAAPDASPAPKWGMGRGLPLAAVVCTLPKVATLGSMFRIAGIVSSRRHLIVGFAQADGDGLLIWLDRHSPTMVVSHICEVDDRHLCYMAVNSDYSKLAAGTASGAIYSIDVSLNPSPTVSRDGTSRRDVATAVAKVAEHPSGPITGLATLSESRTAAACEDGSVRLWQHKDVDGDMFSDPLAVWYLDEPATACDATPEIPLVVVGTKSGVVQIFDAEDPAVEDPEAKNGLSPSSMEEPGAPHLEARSVCFSSRLHSAPVIGVCISPDGSRIASLSADNTMAVLEVVERRSATRNAAWHFQVSCITKVPHASGPMGWAAAHPNRAAKPRLVMAVGAGDILIITPAAQNEAQKLSNDLHLPLSEMLPQTVRTQSPVVSLAVTLAENSLGDLWVYVVTLDRALRRFRVTAASAEQKRATNSYLLPEVDKPRECQTEPRSLSISGNGHSMAVSTADGCVSVYTLPVLSLEGRWPLHDSRRGGASACALLLPVDSINMMAVSGGLDGAVHALELSTQAVKLPRRTAQFGTASSLNPAKSGPGGSSTIPSGFSTPGKSSSLAYSELPTYALEAAEFSKAFETHQAIVAKKKYSDVHKGLKDELERLKGSFRACITENENAPDDEKLPRQEFVVDRGLRNILLVQGDERIHKVKHELQMKQAKELMQYQRITQSCWGQIQQMHTILYSIGADGTFEPGGREAAHPTPPVPRLTAIDNYPIRKTPKPEARQLAVIRFLRQVEMLEWEKRPAKNRGHMVVVGYQASPEDGAEGGATPAAEDSTLSNTVQDMDDDQLVGEQHHAVGWGPEQVLYTELSLHCPLRKRAQISLLEEYMIGLKQTFNKEFGDLVHRKLDAMGKVEEHQGRIVEILKELEVDEKLFALIHRPEEDPEQMLQVNDDEVKAVKYVSPEEQAKLDEEAVRHAAALEAAGKDSAASRALQTMMHGTLEKKEEKRVMLEREEWMDLPPAEMTKQQRQALRDYEKKVAELEEEIDNHRRALEGERKGLESEIEKVITTFNDHLAALFDQKIALQMEIQTFELQSTRMAAGLDEAEYNGQQCVAISSEMTELRGALSAWQGNVAELQRLVLRHRQLAEGLTAEDKQVDKAFKKEFGVPELEEHFNLFTKMFKDRSRAPVNAGNSGPKRGTSLLGAKSAKSTRLLGGATPKTPASGRSSFFSSGGSSRLRTPKPGTGGPAAWDSTVPGNTEESDDEEMDPFADVTAWDDTGDKIPEPPSNLKAPYSMADWPENVREDLFTRLMDLRDAKVVVERELKAAMSRWMRLSALVEAANEEDAQAQAKADSMLAELASMTEEIESLAFDLDVKCKLNMGQIEVPDQAVVPDFADGSLMHRAQVETLNSEVIQRSEQKIEQMTEISEAKRDLTYTDWESNLMDLLTDHKTQHISELQLLHVTREIQEFMADPDKALAYNQEAQLQAQLAANERAHKLKLALMESRIQAMDSTTEQQDLENEYLRENTAKASMALEDREHMNAALEGAEENPARQRAKAFRNVVTNQKLLDISRQQMQEIHYLQGEVARLRQRSFPSFATAPTGPRPPSPDSRSAQPTKRPMTGSQYTMHKPGRGTFQATAAPVTPMSMRKTVGVTASRPMSVTRPHTSGLGVGRSPMRSTPPTTPQSTGRSRR